MLQARASIVNIVLAVLIFKSQNQFMFVISLYRVYTRMVVIIIHFRLIYFMQHVMKDCSLGILYITR